MTTYVGNGSLLQRGDGASPEVFTTIGEVTNVDGGAESRTVINVTNLASDQIAKRPGKTDGGSITFQLNWDGGDAQQAGVKTDYDNKTERNWKLLLTDSPPTEIAFTAFVQSRGHTVPDDDLIRTAITLQVTGARTET